MTRRELGDLSGWIALLGASAVFVECVVRALSALAEWGQSEVSAALMMLWYLPVAPGVTLVLGYGALREVRSPRALSLSVAIALMGQFAAMNSSI